MVSATQAAKAYIPYAWNTSVHAIHDQPVTAYFGGLDIGDRTTGFCPFWDPECPSENTTIITHPSADGSIWMGSLQGHQQFYSVIDTGGMRYTGSNDISTTQKGPSASFSVEEDDEVGSELLRLMGADWYFCEYLTVPFKLYSGEYGHARDQATGACYSAKISRLQETTAAVAIVYG